MTKVSEEFLDEGSFFFLRKGLEERAQVKCLFYFVHLYNSLQEKAISLCVSCKRLNIKRQSPVSAYYFVYKGHRVLWGQPHLKAQNISPYNFVHF